MKSSNGFLLKRFRDISKNKRKTETNDFKVSGKPLGSGFTTELNESDGLQKKMSEKKNFHMSANAFRHHGKAVVDWIADYYEAIESFPILSICLT